MKEDNYKALKLLVANHPGVMAHITGLFSRRGFNMESIYCYPLENPEKNILYIVIKKDKMIGQIVKQLNKLYDVEEVTLGKDMKQACIEELNSSLSALC